MIQTKYGYNARRRWLRPFHIQLCCVFLRRLRKIVVKCIMSSKYVSFIHIFFTGPFLAYVGITKPRADWIYYLMATIATGAAIFLLYKTFGSPWHDHKIWYITHLVLFIPLLLYISLYRHNMNQTFFSFLTAVGIAATGYHLYKIVRSIL